MKMLNNNNFADFYYNNEQKCYEFEDSKGREYYIYPELTGWQDGRLFSKISIYDKNDLKEFEVGYDFYFDCWCFGFARRKLNKTHFLSLKFEIFEHGKIDFPEFEELEALENILKDSLKKTATSKEYTDEIFKK